MLSYGCYSREEGAMVLQKFVMTGEVEKPEYECQVPGIGCRSDNDCHFKLKLTQPGCYCYGSSCVDIDEVKSRGQTKQERIIRWEMKEKTARNKEVNRSCKLGPAKCRCQKGHVASEWERVWHYTPLNEDEGTREAATKQKKSKSQRKKGDRKMRAP